MQSIGSRAGALQGFTPSLRTGVTKRESAGRNSPEILEIAKNRMEIMETTSKSFGEALPVLAVAFQTVGKRVAEPAGGFQTVGKGLPVLAVTFQRVGRAFPLRAGHFQAFGKGLPVLAVAFQTIGRRVEKVAGDRQPIGRRGGKLAFTHFSFLQ